MPRGPHRPVGRPGQLREVDPQPAVLNDVARHAAKLDDQRKAALHDFGRPHYGPDQLWTRHVLETLDERAEPFQTLIQPARQFSPVGRSPRQVCRFHKGGRAELQEQLLVPRIETRMPGLSVADVRQVLDVADSGTILGLRDRALLETYYRTGRAAESACG